jgi:carboxypeptidase Q
MDALEAARTGRIGASWIPARLEIEIRNALDTSVTTADNVAGEIAGSDLKDQLVMLGGHFDSWHAATGATDDAAGVAVALEAMRILKTIGVNRDGRFVWRCGAMRREAS